MGKPEEGEVVLEENQKVSRSRASPSTGRRLMTWQSIIMGIIAQLRPGMDLSRITLPTFILEPKSMLERIAK